MTKTTGAGHTYIAHTVYKGVPLANIVMLNNWNSYNPLLILFLSSVMRI